MLAFQMFLQDTYSLHHLSTNTCADSLVQLSLLFPAFPPALSFILNSRFGYTWLFTECPQSHSWNRICPRCCCPTPQHHHLYYTKPGSTEQSHELSLTVLSQASSVVRCHLSEGFTLPFLQSHSGYCPTHIVLKIPFLYDMRLASRF